MVTILKWQKIETTLLTVIRDMEVCKEIIENRDDDDVPNKENQVCECTLTPTNQALNVEDIKGLHIIKECDDPIDRKTLDEICRLIFGRTITMKGLSNTVVECESGLSLYLRTNSSI